MKKHYKQLFAASCMFALLLSGCSDKKTANDIVILYTNDVHCNIDENIGYSGLAAYKKSKLEKTPYVTLVDVGDAVQGNLMGTVSRGEYIVDIMNEVDYDYAVLGNHEFDFGMQQLSSLMENAEATYLGCNIEYTGDGTNALSKLKPYSIHEYGDVSVAFIGVSTPDSVSTSTPKYFMDENGEYVYNFSANSPEEFFACVQQNIDECTEKGADYVVLLTHLGEDESSSNFSSTALIKNTTGADVVIDGHAHSKIPCRIEQDKNGEDVLLSSTGTGLENIGQIVITANGNISTSLISSYSKKDAETDTFIGNIKSNYDSEMHTVVAVSDTALTDKDANGVRMVRNRETALGNFCADAYRAISEADVAFINGGGIRASLPEGNITYADLLNVHPFGNTLCMVEASGQEILDALEFSCSSVSSEYSNGTQALGEKGGFLNVSGIRFAVNTSIPSSVETDENGMFISVNGERRVHSVYVLNKDGEYEPIDSEKIYTVASIDYILQNCGDGYTMFSDNTVLIEQAAADYQLLITYLTEHLNGELSKYAKPEGRILIN